jgi:hypothetical protein
VVATTTGCRLSEPLFTKLNSKPAASPTEVGSTDPAVGHGDREPLDQGVIAAALILRRPWLPPPEPPPTSR